jgi:hypothetical protein
MKIVVASWHATWHLVFSDTEEARATFRAASPRRKQAIE